MALRINIGCGQTPTQGWRNFDNSFSLRLSRIPMLANFLLKLRLLDIHQYEFIQYARESSIEYGDAIKGLPVQDESAEAIYSSHMLEHLDRYQADLFLKDVFRVLQSGGIIRICVPDINIYVDRYNKSNDADAFIKSTLLTVSPPRSFVQRLKSIVVGPRHHQWMYDGNSLCNLLNKHGFVKTEIMPAGHTKISNYEPLNLTEKRSKSVYVEAEKPSA
tara:strand:- start:4 stop:657 length:654 start_codon:yes stop_codon:yes gene_type:complete